MTLTEIPGVVAFRCLPFLCYVTLSREAGWGRKGLFWAGFLGVVAGSLLLREDISEVLVRGPIVLGYFALVSLGVHRLAPSLGKRGLPRLVLFVLCCAAYPLAPVLWCRDPTLIATVGVGWEAMLSAFSYSVDSFESRRKPSVSDCLFFILVNPSLVYAESGRRVGAEGAFAVGLRRISLGVLVWVVQSAFEARIARSGAIHGYVSFVLVTAGSLLALYCAHSGLASVQIGLARLAGYEVPERYAYPLFAASPDQFWRRWNIYVGSWIKRYVFFPLGVRMRREFPAASGAAVAGTVIAAFVAVGLLHDYAIWIQALAMHVPAPALRVTLTFLAFGGALLLFRGARRGLARANAAGLPSIPPIVVTVVSRAAFLHVLLVMAWLVARR